MFLRSTITTIGAAMFAHSASAQNYNQVVVFGDSTVDSGYYRQLPNPGGGNNFNNLWDEAVAAGAGVPTSRPGLMNSEVLASYFGLTAIPSNLPGGTNYATSGAKNEDTNNRDVNGGFEQAVPTNTQISHYLGSNGGRANPNALYLINSGSNDVDFATGGGGGIPPATPADRDAYIVHAANSLADSVAALKAAGARYIIVPGLTYSFPRDQATDNAATLAENQERRDAKLLYTNQLWSDLAARGVDFIPADFNSVRLAITADRFAFGFTRSIGNGDNQTACVKPAGVNSAWALLCSSDPSAPSHFREPDADQTRLFADDSHFTTAGQKIEADYFYSLLIAPSLISILPETAVKTRMQLTADIETQIALSQSHRGPNGVNAWVSGDIASLDIDNYHGFAGSESTPRAVAAGFDYGIAPGLIAGAAFSAGALKSSFGEFGDFKQDERSVSLYAAYTNGGIWGSAIGTYGSLDYDLNRIAPIGITLQSNLASTEGENWSAAFQGGYNFRSGGLTHGPVIGFISQHVSVEAFTESGSFTSLGFAEQSRDSHVGQLGYRVGFDWANLHPFAQLLWNHEFADTERDVTASLTTIAAPSFALPAVVLGKDWGSAAAGLTIDLDEGVKVVAKGTADFGDSDTVLFGGQLGLNIAF